MIDRYIHKSWALILMSWRSYDQNLKNIDISGKSWTKWWLRRAFLKIENSLDVMKFSFQIYLNNSKLNLQESKWQLYIIIKLSFVLKNILTRNKKLNWVI